MIRKIVAFIPFILLCAFTINLLFVVALTTTSLQVQHYFTFGIIAASAIAYFIKIPVGHLVTGALLFVGAFAGASFMPFGRMDHVENFYRHYI